MKHRHGHLGRTDLEHVAGLHVAELLHVAVGDCISRVRELDVDRHVCREHDGAVRERVRRDGHEAQPLKRRMQDRTTCGERIGRGPRRSRADDAVGRLARHLLPVHVDHELDHAACTAVADADVVDGNAREDRLALAHDLAREHAAHVARVAPREHLRQNRLHVLKHDVRDEAETPRVDADDRNVEARQITGNAQHRAVAAKHDRKVAHDAEFGPRMAGTVAPSLQRCGAALAEEDLRAAGLDHLDQRLKRHDHDLGRLDEDRDFLECRCHGHGNA